MDIKFDYAAFLDSPLIFPNELRSPENLSFIGQLATEYNISALRMKQLVRHCINLESLDFDKNQLLTMAKKERTRAFEPTMDEYSQSPISFLQAKQNGAPVVDYEKAILSHLVNDLEMSYEVINVMIEYILAISDNKLNRKFVDSVAAGWIRNGVRTKQQAFEMARKDRQAREEYKKPKRKMYIEYILQYMSSDSGSWITFTYENSIEEINVQLSILQDEMSPSHTRILARQVSEYWLVNES